MHLKGKLEQFRGYNYKLSLGSLDFKAGFTYSLVM